MRKTTLEENLIRSKSRSLERQVLNRGVDQLQWAGKERFWEWLLIYFSFTGSSAVELKNSFITKQYSTNRTYQLLNFSCRSIGRELSAGEVLFCWQRFFFWLRFFFWQRIFMQEGHLTILNLKPVPVFHIYHHSDQVSTTSCRYQRVLFH